MTSHYVIKLITGESLYATLGKTEKDVLVVKNPMMWEDYVSEDGMVGSTLVKYVTGSDEKDIPISKTAVISMAKMSNTFINFYDAAVAMTDITVKSYELKLKQITKSMVNRVSEYYATRVQLETNDIVAYPIIPADDKDTIH